MSINTVKQNRGETAQRTLWFFGTAPSQKTPRTRIASFLLLSTLFFALSSAQTYALITPGVASKAGNLSRGLIGYWTFDGKNMTSATSTDTSGSGNDGSFHGSPTVSLGTVGQAVTLNGSSYISAAGNNNTTFAVSAWFKVSQSSNYQPILEYSDSLNARYGVFIDGAHPGFVGVDYSNAGTRQLQNQTSGTRKDDGQWHHVVAMNSGGANPVMYIDGAQVTLGNAATPSAASSPNILEIGTFTFTPGVTYFLTGQLDDVRLYNRILTTAEVLALYKMANNATRAAPTGPIAYWKFDNSTLTSATATDSSANKLDLTLTSSPSVVSGKFGQALSFNGTSQYLDGGDINSLDFGTGAFSASVWVKTNTSVRRTILSKFDYDGTGTIEKGYYLHVMASGVLRGGYETNGANYRIRDSSIAVNDNRWHHIVMVRSSVSADTDMYIDGVLSNGSTVNQGTPADTSNSVSFQVGHDADPDMTSLTTYFSGSIDDPRMYNRALSQSEVTALYKNPQTASAYAASVSTTNPISRGLVSNITFDGKYTNTSTSTDVSGTGNDGGLSATPVFALGKVGQALSFNGSSYFVNLGNAANLQLSNGTISAWVKSSNSCSGGSGYCGIITKGNAYSMYTFNNVFGSYDWGAGTFRSSGINIMDGKWHHVAETFQSGVSNGSVIYLDGAPVLTTTMTINSQLYAAEIGRGGTNGGQAQLWNGLIDDARIYNRVLTAKEILALYKMAAK